MLPLASISCKASDPSSTEAIRRVKSLGPFLTTLVKVRRYSKEMKNTSAPCVQDIDPKLLSSSLDGGNFPVINDLPEIIVGDMSLIALSDEQARFWLCRINMAFQLCKKE